MLGPNDSLNAGIGKYFAPKYCAREIFRSVTRSALWGSRDRPTAAGVRVSSAGARTVRLTCACYLPGFPPFLLSPVSEAEGPLCMGPNIEKRIREEEGKR